MLLRVNTGKNASVQQEISIYLNERKIEHIVVYHNTKTHDYNKQVYYDFDKACKQFDRFNNIVDVVNMEV